MEHRKSMYADYEIVPDDIFRRYTKLSSLEVKDRTCPKCKNVLAEDTTRIPIGCNLNVKVPGMFCMRCENFYISDRETVARILRDKACSKNFTLDGQPLWNATEIKEERRSKRKKGLAPRKKKNEDRKKAKYFARFRVLI